MQQQMFIADGCMCTQTHTKIQTQTQLCRGLKMEPEPQNTILSNTPSNPYFYSKSGKCAVRPKPAGPTEKQQIFLKSNS